MSLQEISQLAGAAVLILSFAARTITAVTGTPPRSTLWGKIYMGIEFVALTTAKTKEFAADSPKRTD